MAIMINIFLAFWKAIIENRITLHAESMYTPLLSSFYEGMISLRLYTNGKQANDCKKLNSFHRRISLELIFQSHYLISQAFYHRGNRCSILTASLF